MPSNVEQIDVFTEMIANIQQFQDVMPSGLDPRERILWHSNFSEFVGDELERPFAIIDSDPFGAGRETEGDQDLAIAGAEMILCLSIDTEQIVDRLIAAGTEVNDRSIWREFNIWWGEIFDALVNWQQTSIQYLRFNKSARRSQPWRTPVARREAKEDFCKVSLNLEIDIGEAT